MLCSAVAMLAKHGTNDLPFNKQQSSANWEPIVDIVFELQLFLYMHMFLCYGYAQVLQAACCLHR